MPLNSRKPPRPTWFLVSVAIEAKAPADRMRLLETLSLLANQDGSFRSEPGPKPGQAVLWGTGYWHLDLIIERLQRKYQVILDVARPRVNYCETISQTARVDFATVPKRADAGSAGLTILVEPKSKRGGVDFTNTVSVPVERVPPEFKKAVEEGIQDALQAGPVAGFPLLSVNASVYGGSLSEFSLAPAEVKDAAAKAAVAACQAAGPSIAEPIMKAELRAPESSMSDLIADLKTRRATVESTGNQGKFKTVRFTVPLSEMFGYRETASRLSAGKASINMGLSHYQPVPYDVWKASNDPHSPDAPPTAPAGRPVRPLRPKPGIPGGQKKSLPGEEQ